MRIRFLKLFAAATFSLGFLVSCGDNKPATPFDTLFNNGKKIVIENTPTGGYETKTKEEILAEVAPKTYHNVLDETNETYYFKDLDYASKDKAKWPCWNHVTRALQIAVVANKTNDDDMLDIAYKLGNYYFCNNFTNPNWWFAAIGVPRDFSDLGFFTYKMSTNNEKKQMLSVIRHGSFAYTTDTRSATGCNLYDYAHITLKASILAKDQAELNTVSTYLLPGIAENKEEGFQSDGAFFQHGRMIQSGSYGRQGMIRLSKIAATVANTNVNIFTKDKLRIVLNSVVNGLKYLTHKGSFNYSVLGRTYSRPTALNISGGTTDLGNLHDLKCFLDVNDLPHRAELTKLLNDLEDSKATFSGINYFPSSSLITMNLDDIYMSYRGGGISDSTRQTVNIEGINGENELGYNLSYGTNTCVMETGNEYLNMPALWDYDYLPGTTAVNETDEELKANHPTSTFARKLEGTFLMGHPTSSNDDPLTENIVINMGQTKHEKIAYTITCFATLDGMVILGSNITNDDNQALHTCVEQCRVNTNPNIKESNLLVEHSNVVYRSLDNHIFTVETAEKTGNWKRNNNSYDLSVTERVLKIYLKAVSHYAYSIQSKAKEDKVFKVAANTKDVHAIELPDGQHLAAAFYNDAEFIYNGKTYSGTKKTMRVFDL